MSASRQGMTSAEINQIVAQRVSDAIEAITIYETKICMTHDQMNHIIRQEITVEKNANNKRKANERRAYAGNLPYCNKCKLHHVGSCTVKCNNCHPFNIDLMPVELGSFDVIIGMDWLANHHAVIVCDEKIVWVPYGDEVLIVQGDKRGRGKKSKLSIISCTKTQKCIKKGCPNFLAQITKKEIKDKSEEK
ncbi:putative reverse transcriptase domain-containing protein [Tanacetum coccineum]